MESVGQGGYLAAGAVRALRNVVIWGPNLIPQMVGVGIASIPIALFIAAFTGIVLALQASYTFTGTVPLYFVGALVGTADRMDTIAGCFSIQLEPTGAADPFALRRHSLAIIRIIERLGWEISLGDLIRHSLDLLQESVEFEMDLVFSRLLDFFRELL